MKAQIDRIASKLQRFENLDTLPNVFGADKHEFKLNPKKTEAELFIFEKENQIQLPIAYRNFLLLIGNGGLGPYYGLEPLENGKFIDLDSKDPEHLIDLSKPFPFMEAWNLDWKVPEDVQEEEKYLDDLFEKYEDKNNVNGLLRISNFGCGVWINLVVNGSEYGNIWYDDRTSNQGLVPMQTKDKDRVQFLDWYELWLNSIRFAHLVPRFGMFKNKLKQRTEKVWKNLFNH